jgi:dTDP-4-dehydrorhamnose 3,5-epimerase
MKIDKTDFEGLLIVRPKVFKDERGFFLESYQRERYREFGIAEEFVQDNHSFSVKNVLRGMHYTKKNPQSQLLTVISGRIFDVVVDIRKDSKNFGKWFGIELSAENVESPRQIFMSAGFAHGFCVLSETANLHYKVSQVYNGHDEGGVNWADPTIGIKWPISDPIVASRDNQFPFL